MSIFKKPRLEFTGELHDVTLVNFSVLPENLGLTLPKPLELRLFEGRAMISMVDVYLRNMRTKGILGMCSFDYQHIGFRLLVKDAKWNQDGENHGIYFLNSFTDRPLMVFGGNIVGNYRLSRAQIRPLTQGLNLRQGNQFLHYDFSAPILHESPKQEALHDTIGKIDRAWAIEDDILYKTQIVREKWPLEAVQCNRFETNFFEGARLEGILRVRETIDYTWLPAEPVLELNKENMLPKAVELAYH